MSEEKGKIRVSYGTPAKNNDDAEKKTDYTFIHYEREKVAGKLALRLILLFGVALVLHYAVFLTLVLTGKNQSIDILADYLHVWLPALTGIVSASAAYYFSQGS